MGKNKLKRFAEMENFENCFQFPENIKGTWHSEVFKNNNPIVLELACGRGEYTLGLAKLFPEKNFIGIDVKGSRIWRGAKTALEEGLDHVAFLRIYIEQVANYFDKNEVDEIWITFPDPHPPAGKAKKRLSSLRFLEQYTHFVKDGGLIHLKTDDRPLFDFTKFGVEALGLKIEESSINVAQSHPDHPELDIKTTYELRWISEGKQINYISFYLDHSRFEKESLSKAKDKVKEFLISGFEVNDGFDL